MFFWFGKKEYKKLLKLLEEQVENNKTLLAITKSFLPVDSIRILFRDGINKGEEMADLVLQLGQTKVATLHYSKAGSDLGAVPSGDSPAFSVNDPASISITQNPDGSVTLTDTHNGDADVDVTLTGSAKGFSVTKVVTCKGVTSTPPPAPVPDAVDIVFS